MIAFLKEKILQTIVKNWQNVRISIYRRFSNNNYSGTPIVKIPIQTLGKGKIDFAKNVLIGINPSPFFYNSIAYFEAREVTAKIYIGNNVFINNNFVMICDRTTISIGDDTLIGTGVEIYDSDFHEIDPQKRNSGNHLTKDVKIGKNVFIASNVKIMKGVNIGDNSVIAHGSIVVSDVPENTIYGGNPAKFIKQI